ncbi:MAG TPA: hypothetical protein VJR27_02935 [Candidatus Saccharimonadales bacterium]|nr:hypothetical protein [Candidatus Saccharimonadales bacterium]
MFKRNRETPAPLPHPNDCSLQTLQIVEQRREVTTTEMVPDTSSTEYSKARQNYDQNIGYRGLGFDYFYARAGGEYVSTEVTREGITHLGALSCRQMDKKGIEPITGEGKTATEAAQNVGDTVAKLYCRTCPYFGKDQLEAALYDAQVAVAEREAADQMLAAEQARQEIATINRGLPELPPA